MDLQDIVNYFLSGSGVLVILSGLIEIAPIKVNPWSAIVKKLGKEFNEDINNQLTGLQKQIAQQSEALKEARKISDRREIANLRRYILQFNSEIIREVPHTQEDFVEALDAIQDYRNFCKGHPDYSNGRIPHAIANIENTYEKLMAQHEFAP